MTLLLPGGQSRSLAGNAFAQLRLVSSFAIASGQPFRTWVVGDADLIYEQVPDWRPTSPKAVRQAFCRNLGITLSVRMAGRLNRLWGAERSKDQTRH
jgi:hypothetical protein